ncbi:hypothetical protein RHGRI_022890 [Rhododendron griersonianum]|uniref:Uncharacterized protein n=1 Tax=Rhododendron griersonianum TaxID=479676 RepID=A0AAV6J1R4_9ERIC|nr:hypothetical protein RHGRI_022890 [Rhododendron griersonianum]
MSPSLHFFINIQEWILNKQLNVSLEFQVIELNKKESLQKVTKWKKKDKMTYLDNLDGNEELLGTLRDFFSMQGYAISIKNFKKDEYVIIGCDRGGRYRNKWHVPIERRQRKTATRLIDSKWDLFVD